VARAPIRKLGRNERFVSPALRLFEMGHAPVHLATVIGAVLRYDHPKDEEARELQETIRAESERAALARYAGIEEDHPLVDLVERADERTTQTSMTPERSEPGSRS
jgi:mannitol-1-phosphate 5-dehydrogenase